MHTMRLSYLALVAHAPGLKLVFLKALIHDRISLFLVLAGRARTLYEYLVLDAVLRGGNCATVMGVARSYSSRICR